MRPPRWHPRGLNNGLIFSLTYYGATHLPRRVAYALGRGLEPEDMPAVRVIVRQSERDGYRFTALIEGVVTSTPFRMRKAEEKP